MTLPRRRGGANYMDLNQLLHFDELIKLNLPKNDFAIYGTAPLAIRGLKEKINDIDIVVKKRLWDELILKYPVTIKDFGDEKRAFITIGNIEICYSMVAFEEKSEEVINRADVISGYRFVNLEDTKFWKSYLSRDKDIKDIEKINEYLEKEAIR